MRVASPPVFALTWASALMAGCQYARAQVMVKSNVTDQTDQAYKVTFTNNWSKETHPVDYPSNPSWSVFVVANHGESYEMWSVGKEASAGMKQLAEDGDDEAMGKELSDSNAVLNAFPGDELVLEDGPEAENVFEFEIFPEPNFQFLSFATKMTPSPDWFTGLSGLNLVSDDGFWYDSITLELPPYDAGTRNGDTYEDSGEATTRPIFELNSETVPEGGVLVGAEDGEVAPVAFVKIERLTDEFEFPADDEIPFDEMDDFLEFRVDSAFLGDLPFESPVTYEIAVFNMWTSESHPTDYPSTNAGWSPAVLASHSDTYEMFVVGTLASPSVQKVAEDGDNTDLISELESGIAAGTVGAFSEGSGGTLSTSEKRADSDTDVQGLDQLTLDSDHPFISMISKIIPSPDWVAGISAFEPTSVDDLDAIKWYDNFTVALFAIDAGTDSGTTYEAANDPTVPPEDMLLQEELFEDSVFYNPTVEEELPVALVQFVRVGS